MRNTAAFLLLLLACAACGNTATAAAQTGSPSEYLPLAPGARWELRSRSAPDPMVLEVVGRDGDAYLVRWVNPFIRATFRFQVRGGEVHMSGLDMGQGMSQIPDSTVYW